MVEIVISPIKDEVTIEFTAKLLKDNYPSLISVHTIRHCLRAINQIGVCSLDIDAIMENAYVVKCDITKDVVGIDLPNLKDYIASHICNYNQWTMRPMRNNDNIVLEKNVVTKRNKRRLSVYAKEAEMNKSTNKDFVEWAGNDVKYAFTGVTRFELAVTTCAAIRSVLRIENTNLTTVLNSTAEPIYTILDEALRPDTNYTSTITKLSDFDKVTTMTYYGWDLELIEKNARIIYKEKYHKNKLLPYQRLLDEHNRNAIVPTPAYDFTTLCSFKTSTTTYAPATPQITQDYWRAHTLPFFDGDGKTDYDFITE
ncbi:MAG: hypothetical protein MJZ70_03105 [Bacteroidales bacterium]|nr:hypothetical protein [Bacteroidales bacterium]